MTRIRYSCEGSNIVSKWIFIKTKMVRISINLKVMSVKITDDSGKTVFLARGIKSKRIAQALAKEKVREMGANIFDEAKKGIH
jgi:hypothetical protein